MFLNYDLLAKRWVPYAYIYPFAEGSAGMLMIAGALTWLSVPLALFIGTVGAVSVFKAVYIDRRELKCACVGGEQRPARLRVADREPDDDRHGGVDVDHDVGFRCRAYAGLDAQPGSQPSGASLHGWHGADKSGHERAHERQGRP